MSGNTLSGGTTETKATVAEGHSAVDLQLSNQTFVEVLRHGQRLFRLPTTSSTLSVTLPPGDYTIRTDGTANAGASRNAAATIPPGQDPITLLTAGATLQLSSDATTRHEIDGIALMPADGHSFITITAQRPASTSGNAAAAETVYLRATAGRLTDESGQHTVRSLILQGGSGKFRLVSDSVPKVVTVSVIYGPPPQQTSMDVEFAPV
jgi:hypothetical protein